MLRYLRLPHTLCVKLLITAAKSIKHLNVHTFFLVFQLYCWIHHSQCSIPVKKYVTWGKQPLVYCSGVLCTCKWQAPLVSKKCCLPWQTLWLSMLTTCPGSKQNSNNLVIWCLLLLVVCMPYIIRFNAICWDVQGSPESLAPMESDNLSLFVYWY